jgi:hypothetical protein
MEPIEDVIALRGQGGEHPAQSRVSIGQDRHSGQVTTGARYRFSHVVGAEPTPVTDEGEAARLPVRTSGAPRDYLEVPFGPGMAIPDISAIQPHRRLGRGSPAEGLD